MSSLVGTAEVFIMAAIDSTLRTPADTFRSGLLFAIGSAFAFGSSGPFAKSLMEAGWSPTAAVTARLAGGALAMAVFATVMRPGWLREARTHARTVVLYGLVPIAGAQLFYYNAVSHLSVAVALLLEYTAPVLVVGWLWATTRKRPTALTLGGVVLAVAGIMLVLGMFGPGGVAAAHINLVGVGWGLAAAVCAACYFLMSDKAGAEGPDGQAPVHPITLAAGGLVVGAITVAALGVSGLMPLAFTANDTMVAGWSTS
jgi:drug/metabolite transporter (DMT)-like permease